jgi:hypothetical protein
MSGDRKRQARVHPAREVLNRRLQESFDFGEGDDLVELALDVCARHAEDSSVEKDVFSPGQFRMKACAYFEQTADSTVNIYCALGRFSNPREHF